MKEIHSKQETLEEDDLLDTEIQVVGDNKTQSIRNFLNLSKATTKIYDEDDLRRAIEIGLNAIKDNKEIFRKGLTKKEEIDLLLQSIKQPKQETLEEAIDRIAEENGYDVDGGKVADFVDGMVKGAKWQAERMYSEKEVIAMLLIKHDGLSPEYVLQQFKKK